MMITHKENHSMDKCTFQPRTNYQTSRSFNATLSWDLKHLELEQMTNDFNSRIRSTQNTLIFGSQTHLTMRSRRSD